MRLLHAVFSVFLIGAAGAPAPSLASSGSFYAKSIPNFVRVSEDLYRGGRPRSRGDIAELKRRGVRTVINLENRPADVARERAWAEELGMDYVHVSLSVHERPTDAAVDRVLAVMRDPRAQPVFVHCMHGKDRTGLAFALYRVEEQDWSPRSAYREMLRHGFDTRWEKLLDYFNDRTRQ